MEIRTANSDDRAAWDAYVRAHPDTSPYHLFAWKLAVENAYGHRGEYLVAERDGAVCGVLPLIRFKVPFRPPRLVSLPFCDLGGVLADDADAERALIDEAVARASHSGASRLILRNATATAAPSGLPQRRLATNKVRMVLSLPDSSETLWSSLKSKVRSQVRKAKKNELDFVWGDESALDDFYRVFGQNMRDLGSPVHSQRLFAEVLRHFGDDARLALVRLDGQTVAGAFLLGVGSKKVCVPWASSLREYNRLATNMLLYWRMLEHAADQGYERFDFGRSSEGEGTYRFKKQWGSKPAPLHWVEASCQPGDTLADEPEPSDPDDDGAAEPSRARRWAENVWRRLPVPMANLVGPMVRKYISL
jgi:FemAB-related protein (PEP-CTERM system-associated)